ncbi:hypothetical protein VNO77_49258 [Canavalia gladiata]|uniref:Uncharacterized protein n=1 Tax=Canavalia gladiata TaxID=3824 RepID=A0AAN9JDB2_CANGL
MEFLPLAQSLALPWSSIRSWHSAPRLCLPQPEEVCDWIPKGMLENAIFNTKEVDSPARVLDYEYGYEKLIERGGLNTPLSSKGKGRGIDYPQAALTLYLSRARSGMRHWDFLKGLGLLTQYQDESPPFQYLEGISKSKEDAKWRLKKVNLTPDSGTQSQS